MLSVCERDYCERERACCFVTHLLIAALRVGCGYWDVSHTSTVPCVGTIRRRYIVWMDTDLRAELVYATTGVVTLICR